MMPSSSSSSSCEKISLTLLGCGQMGSAMLRLWMERDLLSDIHVIDPAPLPPFFANSPLIRYTSSYEDKGGASIDSDVFMIAVKPQILEDALTPVLPYIPEACCVISIAAGKELATLSSLLGETHPVVRVMPNTPCSIGKGASASIANSAVSSLQHQRIDCLLQALGSLYWVKDESLMNKIAALSGSGPAYIFYLIEVLSKAGESLGISKDIAGALARQTVIGSAALAEKNEDVPASVLRKNVTSPGGSTQEALNILMDGRLESLFCDALYSAKKRGDELNV